jgi:hypothetical protein
MMIIREQRKNPLQLGLAADHGELDDALGLSAVAGETLADARTVPTFRTSSMRSTTPADSTPR